MAQLFCFFFLSKKILYIGRGLKTFFKSCSNTFNNACIFLLYFILLSEIQMNIIKLSYFYTNFMKLIYISTNKIKCVKKCLLKSILILLD